MLLEGVIEGKGLLVGMACYRASLAPHAAQLAGPRAGYNRPGRRGRIVLKAAVDLHDHAPRAIADTAGDLLQPDIADRPIIAVGHQEMEFSIALDVAVKGQLHICVGELCARLLAVIFAVPGLLI